MTISTTVPSFYTLDDYVPHVVAGVGWTGGWGGVSVVAGYDAVWEEFAVKARVDVKATEALVALRDGRLGGQG